MSLAAGLDVPVSEVASARGLQLAKEAVNLARHGVGVATKQTFAAGQFDERRAGDAIGQVPALGKRGKVMGSAV
jgi:hypothetical protein